ncbi:MAG TPA: GIY-YIG nuclease family protein [Patescibacteria group bacterium]|nr:GIY-YIG nuclease family protein [Patescibacteria group bacterium]
MFYVYILESVNDNKIYIGYTNDLKKRIIKHNNKKVKSTSYRLPLRLIYYEAYQSEIDAKVREKNLKYFGQAYSRLKTRIANSLKTC